MGNTDLLAYGAGPSTLAMAIVFGAIIVCFVALSIQSFSANDMRVFSIASSPKSQPFRATYESIFTLLRESSIFGLILFFAYICEYHPPFPHSDKYYDRDQFFMLTGLLFFASFFTLKKNDGGKTKVEESRRNGVVATTSADNELLNRDQTEEWKGWMQFMFLLYHYFHAEEVYNSIRIMITCYVWMTGFGNFSFFYLKADYSLVRVLQMLWRLNFLVIFLCLTQGTTYILYYICPLHTYFFFMVFVTMKLRSDLNYTKYGLRYKLIALGVFIYLLWDTKLNLFGIFHFFLPTTPQLGAGSGSLWEWYFRTSLDHWSTFLGMIFAANFPITSHLQRKLEAQSLRKEWLAKGSIGICILIVFSWWVTHPFMEPKVSYNLTNAYYGFIPLLTYIYFRNLTPTLRSYSLDLLHQIGKTTLETYLMQHHIWLTSNAKSLLTLIPGYPKMNFLIVTILYFFISRRLYRVTLFLRGMLLPDDYRKCLKSIYSIAAIILLAYLYALVLTLMKMNSLVMIGCSAFASGILLFDIIRKKTYPAHAQQHSLKCDGKVSTPSIGAFISLLLLGLSWWTSAEMGAGKIIPLNSSCSSFVNNGKWVTVNTCNELQSSLGSYKHNINSYAICEGKTWGWESVSSNSLCRFSMRSSKVLKQQMFGQKIVFVGDSTTRNIYHALNRALGDSSAGKYDNSIEKHIDMVSSIADTNLSFRWAPFALDEVEILRDVRDSNPDVVIVGGGIWDRLHHWGTPEDKQAHMDALINLKGELNKLKNEGIAVIWIVPTVINDSALNTNEKKENMRESQVQEVREIYDSQGILDASSFVLEGPAFTKARVAESYDGVHYPPAVYDAGVQILVNGFDWLLSSKGSYPKDPLLPGKMAQPLLGFLVLIMSCIALLLFDSYFGISYLVSFFVTDTKISPIDLYEESFSPLHEKMGLPKIQGSISSEISHEELDNFINTQDIEMTCASDDSFRSE